MPEPTRHAVFGKGDGAISCAGFATVAACSLFNGDMHTWAGQLVCAVFAIGFYRAMWRELNKIEAP